MLRNDPSELRMKTQNAVVEAQNVLILQSFETDSSNSNLGNWDQ